MKRITSAPIPFLLLCTLTCLFALAPISPTSAAEKPEDQTYQDWIHHCEKPADDKSKTCFITQNLVLRETGQRLLTIVVGLSADSHQPTGAITLPLGISLPPGITLQIDNGKLYRISVERCDQSGCLAAFPLSRALLQSFKGGLQAKVTFSDSSRRSITVPVSLKGFTSAYNALR